MKYAVLSVSGLLFAGIGLSYGATGFEGFLPSGKTLETRITTSGAKAGEASPGTSEPDEDDTRVSSGGSPENLMEKMVRQAREDLGLPDPEDRTAIMLASLEDGYQPGPDQRRMLSERDSPVTTKGQGTALSPTRIEVGGMEVMLDGVQAPEKGSICTSGSGTSFDCAHWSREALQTALGDFPVTCEIFMAVGQDKTATGSCDFHLPDGSRTDVGKWITLAGIAFSDRSSDRAYMSEEEKARTAQVGLWSGDPGF